MERYKNFLLIELLPDESFITLGENKFDCPLRIWSLLETTIGNYTIIGKGDELTAEQWDKVVGEWPNKFSKISGYSLLKSKNLSPSTTLIVKQND